MTFKDLQKLVQSQSGPEQNQLLHQRKTKRRILAVDDDPDLTLTVKVGLESSRVFEVNTFNDPELALSSFRPDMYDLVLLDFRMPKINGYELYDKIEQIDNKVKVCFMSATYVNYKEAKKRFQHWKQNVLFKN
ncbi:MAG TPA: response regulator [Nitrososphaeraceae archaeon]